MNEQTRHEVLDDLRKATGRPVRWVVESEPLGDFEGREDTVEVFDVQDFDQRPMFSALRPVRQRAEERLGRSIRVIFHTPQATTRYYAGVRPVGYKVPFRVVPQTDERHRGMGQGLVDDDVFGDPRPPRSKVA